MKKSIFISLISIALLGGCEMKKQNEQLSSENEALKLQLEIAKQSASTLEEIGGLLDSIDQSRNRLMLNMESGTSYDNYVERLQELNDYVADTEEKLRNLESALEKSQGSGNAYAATINRLRSDLKKKTEEIALLQEQVENYKAENENLITTINLQEAELTDKSSQIQTKREELALLEERIKQMLDMSKVSEADQFFARGEAIEEAANRTKLAPRKRKETYKEAMEMFERAKSLGREDAQAKIDELQKKI
ncbi:MAG: hypothetical protein JJU28_22100 [Cyclobacteriaceae bacterium]|nr:hypothetical protein [Cyclobacteriaceae bacterium]